MTKATGSTESLSQATRTDPVLRCQHVYPEQHRNRDEHGDGSQCGDRAVERVGGLALCGDHASCYSADAKAGRDRNVTDVCGDGVMNVGYLSTQLIEQKWRDPSYRQICVVFRGDVLTDAQCDDLLECVDALVIGTLTDEYGLDFEPTSPVGLRIP